MTTFNLYVLKQVYNHSIGMEYRVFYLLLCKVGVFMARLNTDSKVYDVNKCVSVISYLTPIGWLIAIVLHGNHKSSLARFHLRQSLGLLITAALLSFIPLIGWVLNLGVLWFWILGLISAFTEQEKHVPVLGDFYQSHLDFIN